MPTELNTKVHWREGMFLEGVNPQGQKVPMDSRPAGEPTLGPTPMELILHATAGCSAMDIIAILNKRRLGLERFEVEISGLKRDELPRVFTRIQLTYRAHGSRITLNELRKAAALSLGKYCSVVAMMQENVQFEWDCELLPDD